MCNTASRCLAIGFFDGLHLGHQAILSRADSAITFVNHPLSVIAPTKVPKLLMPTIKRVAAIKAMVRLGEVEALTFDVKLQNMSASDFATRLLPRGSKIICGENWRFGQGGLGDAQLLRSQGFEVEVVPPEYHGETMISSTQIRKALANGDLALASAMLGKPYVVYGSAQSGKGEGKLLGYPTLNIDIGESPLRYGVYKVKTLGAIALANFGVAPSFNERAWQHPVLELHFLKDFAKIGEKFIADDTPIELLEFIRPEKKFASLDELKAQIARDYATIVA